MHTLKYMYVFVIFNTDKVLKQYIAHRDVFELILSLSTAVLSISVSKRFVFSSWFLKLLFMAQRNTKTIDNLKTYTLWNCSAFKIDRVEPLSNAEKNDNRCMTSISHWNDIMFNFKKKFSCNNMNSSSNSLFAGLKSQLSYNLMNEMGFCTTTCRESQRKKNPLRCVSPVYIQW